jgi:cell wall-associated NlpC family hydrolase
LDRNRICHRSNIDDDGYSDPFVRLAMSKDQREAIVTEARTWIGTPYHHAADVRGHGVDCAMLLVRVFCDLGLVKKFDPRPYTKDWFLHRSEERYLETLLGSAREVSRPAVGDVVMFRLGRCFAHGGIISRADPLTIVHAYSGVGRVTEGMVGQFPDLVRRQTRFASHWDQA